MRLLITVMSLTGLKILRKTGLLRMFLKDRHEVEQNIRQWRSGADWRNAKKIEILTCWSEMVLDETSDCRRQSIARKRTLENI